MSNDTIEITVKMTVSVHKGEDHNITNDKAVRKHLKDMIDRHGSIVEELVGENVYEYLRDRNIDMGEGGGTGCKFHTLT